MNETALRQIFGLLMGSPDGSEDMLPAVPRIPVKWEQGHARAGVTKNHGQPRNKTRARMARESRKRNRKR